MRLIKSLSILCLTVLFIVLSSFGVGAASSDSDPTYTEDESGWYVIQYTDFKNVSINGNITHTDENQEFPNYSFGYIWPTSTGDFIVDLAFWEDKYINLPANHSLLIEAHFNLTTSSPISSILPTQSNFYFGVYNQNSSSFLDIPYKIQEQTPTIEYLSAYTVSMNYPNPSDNILVKYFRFKFTGLDNANSYSMNVDFIRFKILDERQTNQNIITNGWTANPQKPNGSGKVDQQTQLEEQIKNDTAVGRQETNDLLNSAPSIIGNYTNGFLFLMGLFGLATDIPFIDSLLNISLAMGLFIFFLNLVPSIVSSVQRSSNKKRGG